MVKIKTINVYTIGDSNKARTWSNIPYLLCETLESKGYKINRINIVSNRVLQSLYNRFIRRALIILGVREKNDIYYYKDTKLNACLTFLKIRFQNKKYRDSDLNLFTNYNFYNRYNNKPNILFHDWDMYIEIIDKLKRKPYKIEFEAIERQKEAIRNADLVLSMFAKAAECLKVFHKREDIFHLNQNVINNLYKSDLDMNEIINKKKDSKCLLFIGTDKYVSGANLLAKVFKSLKITFPDLELHMIGIVEKDLDDTYEGVVCHGYLNKTDRRQCDLYYELLMNAKIFINPTPIWGAYSGTLEAMYFYTPIIVSPYDDFVNDFGNNISFGKYCVEFTESYLRSCIQSIIESYEYTELCKNSHLAVQDFTWSNYVDKMMKIINENIVIK